MSTSPAIVEPTPGAKMIYFIRRRAGVAREELVAHWFANHMPGVIASQVQQRAQDRLHAWRYIATLFDADRDGQHPLDGMAQLWWDRPLPVPASPHGETPTDTFQQKAEPYAPWGTTEYVVMDGSEFLDSAPLTLNDAYPMTRSGFLKVTFLVALRDAQDEDELFDHWLDVHVPNVRDVMERVGGFRYVVSHALTGQHDYHSPWHGMAELYFPGPEEWRAYVKQIKPDGMQRWVDDDATVVLKSHVEMVGIP